LVLRLSPEQLYFGITVPDTSLNIFSIRCSVYDGWGMRSSRCHLTITNEPDE
jgi:hypothetical protein